jgi:hypothetical protein
MRGYRSGSLRQLIVPFFCSIGNIGAANMTNIQVVATLYDRNQRPIGCETLPMELTIVSGATQPFSLTLSGQRWLAITTYKLQLDQTANMPLSYRPQSLRQPDLQRQVRGP